MTTELKRISDYLTPGEAFHIARRAMPSHMPRQMHCHDFFEVFLIEKGTLTHYINGTTDTLSAGHLVFIRPADCHAFRADPQSGCETVNVMFRSETAHYLAQRYGADLTGRFFWSAHALPHAQRLSRAQHDDANAQLRDLAKAPRHLISIETFLLTLLSRIAAAAPDVTPHMPAWLTEACVAIRDPAQFRKGAPGFIAAAGRSHEHVCRVSKQVLGMTPSAYVNQIRLDHAADLLRSGDLPIADISEGCGIENLSHFYKLFRARFGTTPRAFRQARQRNPFEAA